MKPFYFILASAIVLIFVSLWLSQRAKIKELEADNAGMRNFLFEKQIPITDFRPRP